MLGRVVGATHLSWVAGMRPVEPHTESPKCRNTDGKFARGRVRSTASSQRQGWAAGNDPPRDSPLRGVVVGEDVRGKSQACPEGAPALDSQPYEVFGRA